MVSGMNEPKCIPYFPEAPTLNERFAYASNELSVSEDDLRALSAFMAPLKEKSQITKFHFEHSQRVALVCKAIAEFQGLSGKPAFYAGSLHDIGKCQVCLSTLGKTDDWTPKDGKIMESHVIDGYRMIADRFDFTAEIIKWHHRFQRNGYPKRLPKLLHSYCDGTKVKIAWYGRLLALADVYDALHRINFHDGEKKILTGEEIKQKMLGYNRDEVELVENLYKAGVLTTMTYLVVL